MTTLDNGVPIPQAAAALGVSEKTIRRRIKAGELRAYEIATVRGPAWRVVLPEDAALSTPAGTVVNPLDNAAVAAALLYLVGAIEAQEARLRALEAPPTIPSIPTIPILPREVIADTPSTRLGTVVKAVDTEAAPGVWARVRAWWREA